MARNNRKHVDSGGDEVYDEIDRFHQERDEKILKDFGKKKSKISSEEVLGVYESESELSDSSEDSVDEALKKRRRVQKEISADAWGKDKRAFYGSRADEDWGGWDEEKDEGLELEEEDAINRQRKLDAAMESIDFAALLGDDDHPAPRNVPRRPIPEAHRGKIVEKKQIVHVEPKRRKIAHEVEKSASPIANEMDEEEVMAAESNKRKITYEMEKNRGLTVKRKKGKNHSRIKRRFQYKKALFARRSQVPDVRREVTKYDGEKRGIRASVVRSIKLKA
ncbi:hypothetical protein FO519_001565 [Halicephalobus sp. NKZ332]|nr:hypothetical protein FO519_001565 [Halicephalobus sp. NKZ332]